MYIDSILGRIISTAVILAGAFVLRVLLFGLVGLVIRRIRSSATAAERKGLEARVKTLASILRSAVSVAISLSALFMILAGWGLDIRPLLTGAGILGLAVGFGTQTLVKDVVTGFFILFENQFNVGDVIKIAGLKGKVKQMNLRTTTLKGENGELYIIPNSKIGEITKF